MVFFLPSPGYRQLLDIIRIGKKTVIYAFKADIANSLGQRQIFTNKNNSTITI